MITRNCSRKSIAISACLCLITAPAALAIELYKYVNEDGVTVLDSQIPSRYVRSGYTIISSDGRVIEVVARALTEAEIIVRDRQAALDKTRLEQENRQAAADATLMRLYSKPGDVIRARDTKLATINSFINSSRGNLQRYVEQRRQFEALAADIERSGGTVTVESVDRIRSTTKRIQQVQEEIDAKLQEIETLKEKYGRDLERVEHLLSEQQAKN